MYEWLRYSLQKYVISQFYLLPTLFSCKLDRQSCTAYMPMFYSEQLSNMMFRLYAKHLIPPTLTLMENLHIEFQ